MTVSTGITALLKEPIMSSRRAFLTHFLTTAGVLSAARATAQQHQHPPVSRPESATPGLSLPTAGAAPARVETPDVPHLPYEMDGNVKVFHLTAEHVRTTFLPNRKVDCWGFNGSMPGPTIEVNQGDRVRIVVDNRLPEIFSMHWHGLEVPLEMDGVPGLGARPDPARRTSTRYEFTLHQHGTFFYHSHMAMQEMMGMIGLLRRASGHSPYAPRVDRDFGLIFQGWSILPNNTVPNTLAMEFNWLTINGKAGPATTPMLGRSWASACDCGW